MKKKVVSILLAFLTVMCVFAAVSCENPGEPSESDSKGSESVSGEGNTVLESDISILPKIDYEGYTFVMTYRDLQNMVRDMSFDKEATDQLEVAKYNRAERVMDYYNIVLEPYVISGDWAGMMALDSVAAGDSDYDIIMPHSHIAWGTYIIEGYALEWTENMKYNYLDQEWWDQGAAECLSIGNKIYTISIKKFFLTTALNILIRMFWTKHGPLISFIRLLHRPSTILTETEELTSVPTAWVMKLRYTEVRSDFSGPAEAVL